MKYKDRDNLVAGLRELADFVEDRGIELPIDISVSATAYMPYYSRKNRKSYNAISEKEKKAIVKQLIRVMKPVKKEYHGNYFTITRLFGKIKFSLSVDRGVVCKKVPTGNKIIHAARYVEEIVEEEVEWVCTDPILKATA